MYIITYHNTITLRYGHLTLAPTTLAECHKMLAKLTGSRVNEYFIEACSNAN